MEYLNSLPKNDLVLLLEAVHGAKEAQSPKQFKRCMGKLKQLMLFDGSTCILSDMDTIKSGKPVYYQQTIDFPEAFVEHYVNEGHFAKSSVLKAAFKKKYPLNWKTIWGSKRGVSNDSAMKFVQDYGYFDGWIITNRRMTDPSVTAFLVAGKKVETGQRTAAILNCIAPHYAEASRSIFHEKLRKHKKNRHFKLTPRELEVLKWIMDGKSTWDISIIFGRSERVVKWHVGNIMQKLGAQNRTHAVAIAMRQGLI
jgi:DNA-binding CsgD family transcriptional regulator